MATQEIYIRNESETEARGPFNYEQLISLTDSGQVTVDTLFYDATTEQWAAIGTSAELKAVLFPEKKKLTVQTKVKVTTLNKETDSAPPITVDDMLAAAEGRTSDTKDKKNPEMAMARAAAVGRWAAIVMLLFSAAGEMLPSVDVVMSMDPLKIILNPLIILGGLDLFLAVMLGLGVVTLYPFVRFRAALGLGFVGFLFWTHGQHMSLVALTAGSAGLYLCTIFVSYLGVAVSAGLGLAGLGAVAWKLIS